MDGLGLVFVYAKNGEPFEVRPGVAKHLQALGWSITPPAKAAKATPARHAEPIDGMAPPARV